MVLENYVKHAKKALGLPLLRPLEQWLGLGFFRQVCSSRDARLQRDFVLDCKGKPLGYSGMLAPFRRCLVVHAGLSPSVASRFTLHSLKTTLAWSSQVEVPEVLREAQGHHRSATVSACVKRYSRDDINPQQLPAQGGRQTA